MGGDQRPVRRGLARIPPARPDLNHYWRQLYDVFPDRQFGLHDPSDKTVLAEGHSIPVKWDGTDAGPGPGVNVTIAGGFKLHAADGQPTAVSALAAESRPATRARPRLKVRAGTSSS